MLLWQATILSWYSTQFVFILKNIKETQNSSIFLPAESESSCCQSAAGVYGLGGGVLCVGVGGVSAKLWVRLIHYRSLGKDRARFPCGG